MNIIDQDEAVIRPQLIERRNGGWLAVTPEGSAIRLGVTADTEAGAREKFSQSLTQWMKILSAENRTAT